MKNMLVLIMRTKVHFLLLSLSLLTFQSGLQAQGNFRISNSGDDKDFPLAIGGKPVPVVYSKEDFKGVLIALRNLCQDLNSITGQSPVFISVDSVPHTEVIIAGTIGKNKIIDQLINEKRLNVQNIAGKWESFLIQTVTNPLPGIPSALVIAGSDKRGTIYGIYELSEKAGVSPWYWWADVPVISHKDLFVKADRYSKGQPAVKYRGIFINDEAPALSGWARENFGGFNHLFYEKVFELILRLHGNFLWPAMWGSAFYDDDSLNAKLTNEYGVVIGTSHHEPMMRAHDEWRRYGKGPWDYKKNNKKLDEFWTEGIQRMGQNESVITLGMRGDGDMPMEEKSNISLLEKIVKDQRKILKEFPQTEKDPQVWALYKEVQDYYDKGMRVPDDVTLLLCDDNWGNIRRVPPAAERNRAGGYGMYYHFDYVGGPRNYKWINTNNISRVWEQMKLAYEYGVDKIWVVNVGDIKPMEFPISFFLDLAWNPDSMSLDRLSGYAEEWASRQFGSEYSSEIGRMLMQYGQLASRRKPELIDTITFNLVNYNEASRVLAELSSLREEAEKTGKKLAPAYQSAYLELVQQPIMALTNQTELFLTLARNSLYARQQRTVANMLAVKIYELLRSDSAITRLYNNKIQQGKWNHMMDQTHIGYTNWQEPAENSTPSGKRLIPLNGPYPGLAVEGSEISWPLSNNLPVLPVTDQYRKEDRFVELFNRGNKQYDFEISSTLPWLQFTPSFGKVYQSLKVIISVDWTKVTPGYHGIPITLLVNGKLVQLFLPVAYYPDQVGNDKGFMEAGGLVSMEASHYTGAVGTDKIQWINIPYIGRTLDGMAVYPFNATRQEPGKQTPRLDYRFYMRDTGTFNLSAYFSPTLDFTGGNGLWYGISLDDNSPDKINLHAGENLPDWKYPPYWNQAVSNNIKIKTSKIQVKKPGWHTLHYWMVDPGLVLQKLVIDAGGLRPSYLGPPESFRLK